MNPQRGSPSSAAPGSHRARPAKSMADSRIAKLGAGLLVLAVATYALGTRLVVVSRQPLATMNFWAGFSMVGGLSMIVVVWSAH
jgi:hypothetical protein